MAESSRHDSWQAGDKYDSYMGRWSRRVAERFLDWLNAPQAGSWVDVGCGTGSLSATILARAAPTSVIGIDASEDFARYAGTSLVDPRASFRKGDAQALDLADASVDVAVSGLVLNFVPDKAAMLREMRRVCRPGGKVGFFVWDYPGRGVGFMRAFWDAAIALDPAAAELAEDRRFPCCTAAALAETAVVAGWRAPEVTAIEIPTVFKDAADFWRPFTLGAGPAPGYCAGLAPEAREALRARLDAETPRAADGSIAMTARAWAVKSGV